MKLGAAAELCENNGRVFSELYKLYNFKDDDDLKAYLDFVIHEPVEWMNGFPAAWKTVGQFSKPRAAFHRLLKQPAVITELTEDYCNNIHKTVWELFKKNMDSIIEKRASSVALAAAIAEDADNDAGSVLTAATCETLPPVPTAVCRPPITIGMVMPIQPTVPKNTVVVHIDWKHKYEVLKRAMDALIGKQESAWPADETLRLRAALRVLMEDLGRV